jgi:hypothetical protein
MLILTGKRRKNAFICLKIPLHPIWDVIVKQNRFATKPAFFTAEHGVPAARVT